MAHRVRETAVVQGSLSLLYRLRGPLTLFLLVLLIGTVGYMYTMDLGVIDAFYFTVITLTTVGYDDMGMEGSAPKLFTIVFVLGGIITASYTAAIVLGSVIEGELQGEIQQRRKLKQIDKLKDHTIICGFGRIGQDLAQSFSNEGLPFVVIEDRGEAFAEGEEAGYTMLRGDATLDEVLKQAGIDAANSIIPALASDADNLFIVMSARQLNDGLTIVARATEPTAESKMLRAGADRVMRPLHIGAQYLAQAVLRPTVLDFIRLSGKLPEQDYALEEILVDAGASLVDKTLNKIGMPAALGVIIIGIKRAEGDLVFNPSGETIIHAGDTLVAMGSTESMDRLSDMAGNF